MINKSSIFRVIEKEHRQRKTMLLCKNSKAEKHFASLLDKALIFYTKEKCCYDKYGNWCYIDFFIPLYNIAIEIEGSNDFERDCGSDGEGTQKRNARY